MGNAPIITEGELSTYGVVDMQSTTHYVPSGSVRINFTVQKGLHFALKTGSGCNIIRRNALPFGYQQFIYMQGDVSLLNDTNGKIL